MNENDEARRHEDTKAHEVYFLINFVRLRVFVSSCFVLRGVTHGA